MRTQADEGLTVCIDTFEEDDISTCHAPSTIGQINGPAQVDIDTPCQEDEACWDCETMGNEICGPELVGSPVDPATGLNMADFYPPQPPTSVFAGIPTTTPDVVYPTTTEAVVAVGQPPLPPQLPATGPADAGIVLFGAIAAVTVGTIIRRIANRERATPET